MTTEDSDVTSQLAGVGRHEHYLSYSQLARALEYTVLGEAVFGLSLAFARISISLFLLRIIRLSRGKKERKKASSKASLDYYNWPWQRAWVNSSVNATLYPSNGIQRPPATAQILLCTQSLLISTVVVYRPKATQSGPAY